PPPLPPPSPYTPLFRPGSMHTIRQVTHDRRHGAGGIPDGLVVDLDRGAVRLVHRPVRSVWFGELRLRQQGGAQSQSRPLLEHTIIGCLSGVGVDLQTVVAQETVGEG